MNLELSSKSNGRKVDSINNLVTVIIVHYRTPDLLKVAVESLYSYYPEIKVWIVDNGSILESVDELFNEFSDRYSTLQIHRCSKNIFHGPAMDYALRHLVKTPFAFLLDSDTETKKGEFLEQMIGELDSLSAYAIGALEKVNSRGFKDSKGMEIPLTPYFMIRTDRYSHYEPFAHHGQPTLAHFTGARKNGEKLLNYPIEQYIDHKWRGTASRFGYQLGWKARLDYLLNKIGL